VIVEADQESLSKHYEIEYSIGDDGVVFKPMEEWVEVVPAFVPVQATLEPADTTLNQNEEIMDLERLIELLGLTAGATEEQVIQAIQTTLTNGTAQAEQVEQLTDDLETLRTQVSELQPKAEGAEETETQLTHSKEEVTSLTQASEALRTENVTLASRLQSLESDKADRELTERLSKAIQDKKLLPVEIDGEDAGMRVLAQKNPELFDQIIANRPVHGAELTETVSVDGDPVVVTPDADLVDQFYGHVRRAIKDNGLEPEAARLQVYADHPEFESIRTEIEPA